MRPATSSPIAKAVFCVFLAALFPAVLFGAEYIIATVNKAEITKRQLDEAVEQIVPRSAFHGTIREGRREEFQEKALELLITRELQYQDAVARGLKIDRKEVKGQFRQLSDSFRSSKEFKVWMLRNDLDEDRLKALIEKNLLIRKAASLVAEEPARMSDEAVREYYNSHPEKFREPESVNLRIISVKDVRKADEAQARLKSGEDFSALAASISEDNFRVKGGSIGTIRRGMIQQAVEEAAFALKAGETSATIPSEGLFYIIKVEDKEPARDIPFKEAKDALKKELEDNTTARLLDEWTAGLRSKAEIKLYIPAPGDAGE